jgi:predicted dehydrogenase
MPIWFRRELGQAFSQQAQLRRVSAHHGRKGRLNWRAQLSGMRSALTRRGTPAQPDLSGVPMPHNDEIPSAVAIQRTALTPSIRPARRVGDARLQPDGLRLGVVGVGHWGSKHVRALGLATGVSAVVSIDQRLGAAAGGGPDGHRSAEYSDLAAALASVDALVIATPPCTHADVGLQAIAAGKHVLIEKPLATSSSEALSLIEAADAAGVVLMSGHTFEHNAAVHKLRDVVRRRELGQLYYLDCARLNLGLYRSDVGVIADLAPHDISIANFVLGSRPTTVTAWGSRYINLDHEDVAQLRLDYADVGVRANIQVSWLSPVKVRRITAVGSKRMAVYDDLAEDERIRVYDKSALPAEGDGPQSPVDYHLGDMVAPHVDFAEPLVVQDQHFVDCILTGRRPTADGSSGLTVVQVVEAAQISLTEQRPVALAELSQLARARAVAKRASWAASSLA